jgi:hypothetical protein
VDNTSWPRAAFGRAEGGKPEEKWKTEKLMEPASRDTLRVVESFVFDNKPVKRG